MLLVVCSALIGIATLVIGIIAATISNKLLPLIYIAVV
jgi:hypothetical protein